MSPSSQHVALLSVLPTVVFQGIQAPLVRESVVHLAAGKARSIGGMATACSLGD